MLHEVQRRRLKVSCSTLGQTAAGAAATAGAQAARAATNIAAATAAAAEDTAAAAAAMRAAGGSGNGVGYRRVVDAARAWVVVEDEDEMDKAVAAIHELFPSDVRYDDGANEGGEEACACDLSGWRVRRLVVQCSVTLEGQAGLVLAEVQVQLRSLAGAYARGQHKTHTQKRLRSAVDRLVSDSRGGQQDEPLDAPVLRSLIWRAIRSPPLDRAAVVVAVTTAERTGGGVLAADGGEYGDGVEGGAAQLATACKPRALMLLARCSSGAMRPSTKKVGCHSRYMTAGWAFDKGVIQRSNDSKKKNPNRITSLFGYLPSGREGPSRGATDDADGDEGDGDDRALGLLEEAVAMQERMVGRQHLRSCSMYATIAETLARIYQRDIVDARSCRQAEALEWSTSIGSNGSTSIGSNGSTSSGRAERAEGEGAIALRWAPKTLGVRAVHDEAVVRWAVSVETGGGEAIFRELAAQKVEEMEANKRPGEDTRPRALAEARREVAAAKFDLLDEQDLERRKARRRKQRKWRAERRAKRRAGRAEAKAAEAAAVPAVPAEQGAEGGGNGSDDDDDDGGAEEDGLEGVDKLHCAMGYLRRVLRIRSKAFGRGHYSLIPIHVAMAGYCVLGHEEEDEVVVAAEERDQTGEGGAGEAAGEDVSPKDVSERYQMRSKCLTYPEHAVGEGEGEGGGAQPMARRCTLGAAARHLTEALWLCSKPSNQEELLASAAIGAVVPATEGTEVPGVADKAPEAADGAAGDEDEAMRMVLVDLRGSLQQQLPVVVELMKRLALVREAMHEKCEEQWENEAAGLAEDPAGEDEEGGSEQKGQGVGEEQQRFRGKLLMKWRDESEDLRSRAAGARHAEAGVLWRCNPKLAPGDAADSTAVAASPLQMHAATLMLQACAADAVRLWSRVALQRAQAGRMAEAMSALKFGAVPASVYTYAARTNTQTGGGGSVVWKARACQQHAQLHLLLGIDGEGKTTAAAGAESRADAEGGGGGQEGAVKGDAEAVDLPDLSGVGGMNGGWAAAKAALMPLLHALRSRYGTRDEKVRVVNRLAIALEAAASIVANPVLLVGEDGGGDEEEKGAAVAPVAAAAAEKLAVEEDAAAEEEAPEEEDWGVLGEATQKVLCISARVMQTEVASHLVPELPPPSSAASSFSGMAEPSAVREAEWEERLRLVKAAAMAWVGVAKLVTGASLRSADSSRDEVKELKDPAGVWLFVYTALRSAFKGLQREQRLQQNLEELQEMDVILSVKAGERAEGLRELVSETLAMTVNLEGAMTVVEKCAADARAVVKEKSPAQRATLLAKYKENAAKAVAVVTLLYQLGRE
jgi:hypothetical protein